MSGRLYGKYERRYRAVLTSVADRLSDLISDHLSGTPRIDRVAARAKTPERFCVKAQRKNESGRLRYRDPFSEIQDQIGARVVVFYQRDVESVETRLMRYFNPIEMRTLVPDSEWAFGYFGKHYIMALPTEAIPAGIESADTPRFFELQIKTLFQHAWAEANHDLGYKPLEELTSDQKRRLAYTAAQAWGADRVFGDLVEELAPAQST
jgi:GTP pyrophosphokinase